MGCRLLAHIKCIDPLLTCRQLIQDCFPRRATPFLSGEQNAKGHHHRSLIVNLACGAVVHNKESLHSLSDGSVSSVQCDILANHCNDPVDIVLMQSCHLRTGLPLRARLLLCSQTLLHYGFKRPLITMSWLRGQCVVTGQESTGPLSHGTMSTPCTRVIMSRSLMERWSFATEAVA